MAGSRALPDLVARIRVDSSGVDQAIGSLIGSFGKADLALAGVAAGIGLLIVGGKSMIDIAERRQEAERGLSQAYATQKLNLDAYRGNIDKFITTNRSFVSNQSEVLDGFAKLTRAGLSQNEVQRVMNDAVDLSALKHISLSDAVDVLNAAEHGRMKGLIDLGITTKQLTDENGKLLKGQPAIAAAMKEVDDKVKGGRDSLTDTEQAYNRLNNDWQDLATKGGPPLIDMLDAILHKADDVYTAMEQFGNNPHSFDGLNGALVQVAQWIHDYILVPLGIAWNYIAGIAPWGNFKVNPGGSYGMTTSDYNAFLGQAQQTGSFGKGGRASGGPVVPGGAYTVGENGPETLVMGASGGYVYPNGGGAGTGMVHVLHDAPIILDGAVIGRYVDSRVSRAQRYGGSV